MAQEEAAEAWSLLAQGNRDSSGLPGMGREAGAELAWRPSCIS